MGGHGGAKKKVKAAVVTATKTVTAAPVKPLRPKRAAPGPADEAAQPAKKQAKLPEHVPVGKEEASKSESARPVVNRKAMEAAKTKQHKGERFGLGKPAGPGGAVVYLGHIPHGFYEEQMKGFFTQFGSVSRLRLARNRKTGRSKHFAFIEFEHREVAEVVSKAMNGYLLYSKILECRLLKPEEVRPKTFNVSKANLQLVNRPIDQLRNTERTLFNAERSVEKQEKLAGRRAGAARQRGRQWAKVGIEYDFEGVSGEAAVSDPSKKKPKAAKVAKATGGKATGKATGKAAGKAAAKPAGKAAAKPKAAAQEPPASASKTAGAKRAAPSPGAQKAAAAGPRSGTPAKSAKRAKAA